jgi:hypothetical protein
MPRNQLPAGRKCLKSGSSARTRVILTGTIPLDNIWLQARVHFALPLCFSSRRSRCMNAGIPGEHPGFSLPPDSRRRCSLRLNGRECEF